MESVRSGLVFFLRPHRELLASDGVREEPDWEEVLRIDGMVKLMLESFDVPYIPVASLSMQERVRLLQRVLDLAGVRPAAQKAGEDLIPRQAGPRTNGNGRNGNGAERQASAIKS